MLYMLQSGPSRRCKVQWAVLRPEGKKGPPGTCLWTTSASAVRQLLELPTVGGHLKPPALSANDGWAADLDDGGDKWQDMDAQSPGSVQSDATSTGWLCCEDLYITERTEVAWRVLSQAGFDTCFLHLGEPSGGTW